MSHEHKAACAQNEPLLRSTAQSLSLRGCCLVFRIYRRLSNTTNASAVLLASRRVPQDYLCIALRSSLMLIPPDLSAIRLPCMPPSRFPTALAAIKGCRRRWEGSRRPFASTCARRPPTWPGQGSPAAARTRSGSTVHSAPSAQRRGQRGGGGSAGGHMVKLS